MIPHLVSLCTYFLKKVANFPKVRYNVNTLDTSCNCIRTKEKNIWLAHHLVQFLR